MGVEEYYFWQLVVAAIGIVVVIAYVVFTALLYWSNRKSLKELREANKKHDDEFKMSMRPWIGFEEFETNLSKEKSTLDISFYVKNPGSSPALKVESFFYFSDRSDVFLDERITLPQLDVLPNDRKNIRLHRSCELLTPDKKSPVYVLSLVTYESFFGLHWSKSVVRIDIGVDKIASKIFEMGEGAPPVVKTYGRSQGGEGYIIPFQL